MANYNSRPRVLIIYFDIVIDIDMIGVLAFPMQSSTSFWEIIASYDLLVLYYYFSFIFNFFP